MMDDANRFAFELAAFGSLKRTDLLHTVARILEKRL